jgi:hypothetical protein
MQQWRAQNQPTKFHKMQHRIDTLEAALRDVWSLPPGPNYHEQIGTIARRALEPSDG